VKSLLLPQLLDKYEDPENDKLKPFEKWEAKDLELLIKYIKTELKERKETRPFWV